MENAKNDALLNSTITTIISLLKEERSEITADEIKKKLRPDMGTLIEKDEFKSRVKLNNDLYYDIKNRKFMLPIHKEIHDDKSLDKYFASSWENIKECIYEDELKYAYPNIEGDINRKKMDKSIIAVDSKPDKRTVIFGRKQCKLAEEMMSMLEEEDTALIRSKWDKLRPTA